MGNSEIIKKYTHEKKKFQQNFKAAKHALDHTPLKPIIF